MKVIVITGSTRGIGRGLADSFLALGCAVTVSGRVPTRVEKTVAELSSRHEEERVLGHAADVTRMDQVQALWDTARARFGKVDIWINNAGISHPQLDFWEHPPERIESVVVTNLIGTMYGSRVALRGMVDQGFGSLYLMEGLGSDGRRVAGLTLYGSTKSAVGYLTESLIWETRAMPIIVGAIRPGMVVTDLLTRQYEAHPEKWESAKRIFNILADHVETVTPWLARKILSNDKHGIHISWLTRRRIMGRFLTLPFRRRELFE